MKLIKKQKARNPQKPQNPLDYFGNRLVVEELQDGSFCAKIRGLYADTYSLVERYRHVEVASVALSISDTINRLTAVANRYYIYVGGEHIFPQYPPFVTITESDIQKHLKAKAKKKDFFFLFVITFVIGLVVSHFYTR